MSNQSGQGPFNSSDLEGQLNVESDSNVLDLFLNSESSETLLDSEATSNSNSGLAANSPDMIRSILSEISLEKADPKVRFAIKTYTRVATSKWNEETQGFHIKRAA